MRYHPQHRTSVDEIPSRIKALVNVLREVVDADDLYLERMNRDRWVVRLEGEDDMTSEQLEAKFETAKTALDGLSPDHEGWCAKDDREVNCWLIRFDFDPPGNGWQRGPPMENPSDNRIFGQS